MLDSTLDLFQYINRLPDAACYALINEDTKSVYIMHTTNLKSKLGVVAENIAVGKQFEYFCISADPVYKLIMSEGVRKDYLARGYKIENQVSPFISFKVGVRIDADGRNAIVYIVSARGYKEVVGVFKNIVEADEFRLLYGAGVWDGVTPIYAINKETREYWQKHGYKHSRFAAKQYFVESNEVTQTE